MPSLQPNNTIHSSIQQHSAHPPKQNTVHPPTLATLQSTHPPKQHSPPIYPRPAFIKRCRLIFIQKDQLIKKCLLILFAFYPWISTLISLGSIDLDQVLVNSKVTAKLIVLHINKHKYIHFNKIMTKPKSRIFTISKTIDIKWMSFDQQWQMGLFLHCVWGQGIL